MTDCWAFALSSVEQENTEISSANPLTLWDVESLITSKAALDECCRYHFQLPDIVIHNIIVIDTLA